MAPALCCRCRWVYDSETGESLDGVAPAKVDSQNHGGYCGRCKNFIEREQWATTTVEGAENAV